MTNMPPLPSDIRELVLFMVQDIQTRLNKIEELLCLSDEEEEMTPEDEEFELIERRQLIDKETALRQHAYNRACEVMRELNNAELSQMTMLRVFALGYRAAVLDEQRKKDE